MAPSRVGGPFGAAKRKSKQLVDAQVEEVARTLASVPLNFFRDIIFLQDMTMHPK
jgi:hypothetical protein